MAIRFIVCGCKTFHFYEYVEEELDKIFANFKDEEIIIMSGGCYGTDLLVEKYARKRKLKLEIYSEKRDLEIKEIRIRNQEMLKKADRLIAFSSGDAGTSSLVFMARSNKIPALVYDIADLTDLDFPYPLTEGMLLNRKFEVLAKRRKASES